MGRTQLLIGQCAALFLLYGKNFVLEENDVWCEKIISIFQKNKKRLKFEVVWVERMLFLFGKSENTGCFSSFDVRLFLFCRATHVQLLGSRFSSAARQKLFCCTAKPDE